MNRYTVVFTTRTDNTPRCVHVLVAEAPGFPGMFYAKNLSIWGCGKNAPTPYGAIRALVQDMANINEVIDEEGNAI